MSQPLVPKPIDSRAPAQVTEMQAYPSAPGNQGFHQQPYQPTATPGQQQQQQQGAVPMVVYQQAPANGQMIYQQAPGQVYQMAPPVYHQTPANIVQVQPGAVVGQDYTLPQAKAPGILLLISAFFMGSGFTQIAGYGSMGVIIPVITYGILGGLCLLAHAENKGRGMVTLILTMSCLSLLVCTDIMVVLSLLMIRTSNTRFYSLVHEGQRDLIMGYCSFMVITVLVAFGSSIAMIIITSKKVCRCCGAQV